ncbi:unnamed protein product [Alopecurus aequalis]
MATATATRPSGPVLIPIYGSASPSRVKLAPARSPAKSVTVSSSPAARSRQSCMCSPTNHKGSFRCSLHKERKQQAPAGHAHGHIKPAPTSPPSPVVSPGAGARFLACRALAPPQQSQSRRRLGMAGSFRPRPSRLSAVSFARDNRQ